MPLGHVTDKGFEFVAFFNTFNEKVILHLSSPLNTVKLFEFEHYKKDKAPDNAPVPSPSLSIAIASSNSVIVDKD